MCHLFTSPILIECRNAGDPNHTLSISNMWTKVFVVEVVSSEMLF